MRWPACFSNADQTEQPGYSGFFTAAPNIVHSHILDNVAIGTGPWVCRYDTIQTKGNIPSDWHEVIDVRNACESSP